ncbi:MAG: hypothetical protein KBG48_09945 [Kofleriaceae bacterium]|nr:hypothetical protein [Kofleriaceae bacterium]MBP9167700.1 hypothetical protein [Kofleriaceae bacterium]MBP9857803.1 hypothetical protein [Kofleriaceae bacterium]
MPWFHLCTLLDKVTLREPRAWYLANAVKHGWSRNVLVMQTETQAHARSGRATTNFHTSLPAPQSNLGARRRAAARQPRLSDHCPAASRSWRSPLRAAPTSWERRH